MDVYTYLYLADKVDAISFNLTFIGMIGSCFLSLVTVGALIEAINCTFNKILLILITLVFYLIWFAGLLMPSKDFMYQAGAVYLGKEVIKNEQVQETFNKVKKVIDLNLDKQIKELTETK